MLSSWIDNTTNWLNVYHKNIRTGVMYPIVLINEYANVNEQLAAKFNVLYLAQGMQVGGFWVLLVAFLVFSGLGFGLIFKSWMQNE